MCWPAGRGRLLVTWVVHSGRSAGAGLARECWLAAGLMNTGLRAFKDGLEGLVLVWLAGALLACSAAKTSVQRHKKTARRRLLFLAMSFFPMAHDRHVNRKTSEHGKDNKHPSEGAIKDLFDLYAQTYRSEDEAKTNCVVTVTCRKQ